MGAKTWCWLLVLVTGFGVVCAAPATADPGQAVYRLTLQAPGPAQPVEIAYRVDYERWLTTTAVLEPFQPWELPVALSSPRPWYLMVSVRTDGAGGPFLGEVLADGAVVASQVTSVFPTGTDAPPGTRTSIVFAIVR